MADKHTFPDLKAEQARMTKSWKSEGRLSEAWSSPSPKSSKFSQPASVSAYKPAAAAATIPPIRRTNGAEPSAKQWTAPPPLKPNSKRPDKACNKRETRNPDGNKWHSRSWPARVPPAVAFWHLAAYVTYSQQAV
jgi:hypothetical protein